jgi:membrane protein DedA with SNARE-associated domain
MHWFEHIIRYSLAHYGYWAVLAGLLIEDAGIPWPGETTLVFAAFVAHKTPKLEIGWVIVVGIIAATLGDNIGYFLGHKFGRHLLRWIKKIFRMDDEDIGAAKDMIKHHGNATIYWARFIFGLRTIAGPMAGSLGMEWKKFAIWNALGAATWVTVISFIGYAFASEFNTLLGYFEKASWALAAGLLTIAYLIWRHQKKRYKERHHPAPTEKAA